MSDLEDLHVKQMGEVWMICDWADDPVFEECPCCGLPFKSEQAAQTALNALRKMEDNED